MNDTEKLALVRDVCAFWDYEYHHNDDLRWNSMVWAQVLMDMVGPITGSQLGRTSNVYYTVSKRQKSIQIMNKRAPLLFARVKPFLNMEKKDESK